MLGFMRELETDPRVEHNINPKAGLYSNGVPCCYITISISEEDDLHCFLVRGQWENITYKARKMLSIAVKEELETPVTQACLKHLLLQLSLLCYYRKTPWTKPVHESNIRPTPTIKKLPSSNYYRGNPYEGKILSHFHFLFTNCFKNIF